ncbi:hypothetical protein KBX51_10090 [Corynebacterium sp. CCUG 60159]|nr:hypothetical protein [Corynebacterium pseudogenitalium]
MWSSTAAWTWSNPIGSSGRGSVVDSPTAAVGDAAEFLHIDMDELAWPPATLSHAWSSGRYRWA